MPAKSHILLVEDNSFDAKVFQRALRDKGLETPITIVKDGIEALETLRMFSAASFADLIIVTDLKLPCMDGIDLLRRIRKETPFTDLPIFVVTTSDAPADRYAASEFGIEAYICKTGPEFDFVEPIIAFLNHRERWDHDPLLGRR